MNLNVLAEKLMDKYELGEGDKDQAAVRQQLDRILREIPEAKSWYKKQGRKGTWDIPDEAVSDITRSAPFLEYARKRANKETKTYKAIVAAFEEAQRVTQAEQERMEERASKTADDAAREEWSADPYHTPEKMVAAEETTLLLRGIVGLIAAQDNKAFDYEAFKEAHRELVRIREWNQCALVENQGLSEGEVMQLNEQEELVSDLRNFFVNPSMLVSAAAIWS